MQLADKRSERVFEIRLVSSATLWPCSRLLTPARSTAGQISRSQPPLLYLERPIAETDRACCATVVRRVALTRSSPTFLPENLLPPAWVDENHFRRRTDESPSLVLSVRPEPAVVRYSDDGLNLPPSSFVTQDISRPLFAHLLLSKTHALSTFCVLVRGVKQVAEHV